MKVNSLFGLLIMFSSVNSFANYTCSGQVNGVGLDPKSGAVIVESIGPLVWPRLCSVKTEFNGVSVESCKVVYSTLLTAQSAKMHVRLWFNDDKDCSTSSHEPWQTLTGWYFGPVINN